MSVMGGLTGAGAAMGQAMGLTQANALLGIQPGWFWQAGGWMASGMVKGVTQLMPSAMASALGSALDSIDLSGQFASAFSHPFASFQMNMDKSIEKWRDAMSEGWNKADQAASKYAKAMGLSGTQMARLRDEMIDFANNEFIGSRFNKSIEEATALIQKFSSEIGRQTSMTNAQKESLLGLSSLLGDEVAVKFSSALDKFGLSATSAGDMMTKMFNKSVKQGLDLTKYAKNVTDHLALAQKYSFKDGTKGLMNMAEMATKIKMDMGMVAQFADRVSNVSDAVNVGAQLQVLGGPFAQFGDPLRMLYGSLNDMGDFSKQFAKLTEKLGRFDKESGEFNISNFDKVRLREAAKAMGVDYEKLIDQATTQARRREIEKQMPYFNNIPEEFKEWVKNNATFEGGVAGIKAKDGTFKALNSLGKADFETLVNETKSEAENIADIAEMLRGALDTRQGLDKERENTQAKLNANIAESNKTINAALSTDKGYLYKYIELQNATQTRQMFSDVVTPITNILSTAATFALLRGRGGGKATKLLGRRESGGLISPSVGNPGQEYALNGHDGQSAQPAEFVTNARATANNLPILSHINANPNKKFRLHSDGGVTTDSDKVRIAEATKAMGVDNLSTIANDDGFDKSSTLANDNGFDWGEVGSRFGFEGGHALLSGNQAKWNRALRIKNAGQNIIPSVKPLLNQTPEVGSSLTKMTEAARLAKVSELEAVESTGRRLLQYRRYDVLKPAQATRYMNDVAKLNGMGYKADDVIANFSKYQDELKTLRSTKVNAVDDIVKTAQVGKTTIQGGAKTAANTVTKTAANTATKTAAKVGAKTALKGVGSAAFGGLLSAGFTAWDEYDKNNFVMNRGEAFGATIGSGVLGTLGTIAGTAIGGPVVGAALGALGAELGELAGRKLVQAVEGTKEEKLRKKYELSPKIKNNLGRSKFLRIKGDFRKTEWEQIAQALQDGNIGKNEIPDWLREKLELTGNQKTLVQGKYKDGGILMNSLIQGNSHESGGVKFGGIEAEGGELIASKKWVQNNPNTATKILNQENTDIQAKEPIGKQMKVNERSSSVNNTSIKIELPPLKIDLSGTLNLTGAVNSTIDGKELEKAITNNVVAQLQQKLDKLINKDYDKRETSFKGILPS